MEVLTLSRQWIRVYRRFFLTRLGLALSCAASVALAVRPAISAPVSFADEFDGGTLSSAWVVTTNGGMISLSGGVLTLAGSGVQFPYIVNSTPLIPEGDFTLSFRMKHDTVTNRGTGLQLAVGAPPNGTPTAGCSGFSAPRFLIWQDSDTPDRDFYYGFSAPCALLWNTFEPGTDLGWHDYVLTRVGLNHALTRDGAFVWTGTAPVGTQLGLDVFFGNWESAGSSGPWSSLSLDYIRVEAPNDLVCADVRTSRCIAGRPDNFATADGPEPSTPSAPLVALIGSAGVRSGFDVGGVNQYFAHTFTNAACDCRLTIDRAVLKLNVIVAGSQATTDVIYLGTNGVIRWGLRMNALQAWHTANTDVSWSSGDRSFFALDLGDLPTSDAHPNYGPTYPAGVTSIIANLQNGAMLDVAIGDDSNADYAVLETSTCPASISGTVQATVSELPYRASIPVGLAVTTVRVKRGSSFVGAGATTANPKGDFLFSDFVECGDQLTSTLQNNTLSVISLPSLPQAPCTSTCQSLPLVGAPVHFAWGSSDAVNAFYLAEAFSREFWWASLGVALEGPYQLRVDDQSHSTAHRYGGAATGIAAGRAVTSFEPGKPQYTDAVCHEFVHRVIIERIGNHLSNGSESFPEAGGMDEGLADYFTAAYTGNSRFGSSIPGLGARELDQEEPVQYLLCDGVYDEGRYFGARVFGGALWDARKALMKLGVEGPIVDRWVYDALGDMQALSPADRTFLYYRNFLLTTPPLNLPAYNQTIRNAFARHNIVDSPLAICSPRPVVREAVRSVDSNGQHITLGWTPVPSALFHRLYVRVFGEEAGLGPGALVADSLHDSTYAYTEADTSALLAFVVVAVDSSGGEGPPSSELPAVTAVPHTTPSNKPRITVFPNPTAARASISFVVPARDIVQLTIYDVAGRSVRTLWSGAVVGGTEAVVTWDGRDHRGHPVRRGLYMLRLDGQHTHLMRRIVILP
jgi:hypothetical protein